jgi:hypothetical protein
MTTYAHRDRLCKWHLMRFFLDQIKWIYSNGEPETEEATNVEKAIDDKPPTKDKLSSREKSQKETEKNETSAAEKKKTSLPQLPTLPNGLVGQVSMPLHFSSSPLMLRQNNLDRLSIAALSNICRWSPKPNHR